MYSIVVWSLSSLRWWCSSYRNSFSFQQYGASLHRILLVALGFALSMPASSNSSSLFRSDSGTSLVIWLSPILARTAAAVGLTLFMADQRRNFQVNKGFFPQLWEFLPWAKNDVVDRLAQTSRNLLASSSPGPWLLRINAWIRSPSCTCCMPMSTCQLALDKLGTRTKPLYHPQRYMSFSEARPKYREPVASSIVGTDSKQSGCNVVFCW